MSDEEIILWSELRQLRAQGLHFRRQVPRGRYVLDFACLKAKAVIEVDGEQHFLGSAPRHDAIRDRYFQRLGFMTLRYTTREIRLELDAVVEDIFARVSARLTSHGGGGSVFPPLMGEGRARNAAGEVPPFAIAAETPLQDDVRQMIVELNAIMQPLTPREFQFQMTAEQIAETGTTLFVLRDAAGNAVGMGALKVHDDALGEIKRMYTRPQIRGTGQGGVILQRIENLAREKRLACLVLETGEAPGFEAAWRVYERGGYTQCGAVLDYPDSGWSRFYEKRI